MYSSVSISPPVALRSEKRPGATAATHGLGQGLQLSRKLRHKLHQEMYSETLLPTTIKNETGVTGDSSLGDHGISAF